MKFHNKILYFLCFLLTTSCQSIVQHVQLADQEMFSFAREVKATDDLKLISYGGGFLGCINSFSLTFSSKKTPTIDQARVLFLRVVNKFLARVNHNQELHDYLANHPFTIKNLEFIIMFPDQIGFVNGVATDQSFSQRKHNNIYYFGYNPYTQKSEIIFDELYETSVSIVEQQENLSITSEGYP